MSKRMATSKQDFSKLSSRQAFLLLALSRWVSRRAISLIPYPGPGLPKVPDPLVAAEERLFDI
jgi:hypothetical protein